MPWGDRTGPLGQGPRTGRGLGYCAGYDSPGYTKGTPMGRGWFGRGWGRGFGFGRGFGWRWNWPWSQSVPPEPTKSTERINNAEITAMKNELNSLKTALDGLLARLNTLTSKSSESDNEKE